MLDYGCYTHTMGGLIWNKPIREMDESSTLYKYMYPRQRRGTSFPIRPKNFNPKNTLLVPAHNNSLIPAFTDSPHFNIHPTTSPTSSPGVVAWWRGGVVAWRASYYLAHCRSALRSAICIGFHNWFPQMVFTVVLSRFSPERGWHGG